MPCAITDKTTKEIESKKHKGSKIIIKKITQKCASYSDDLQQESEEDNQVNIADELVSTRNNEEISADEIKLYFQRYMKSGYEKETNSNIGAFADKFKEYVKINKQDKQ